MINKKSYLYFSRWVQRNLKDKYVREAKKKKLRSRSWFKLEEINRSDRIFFPGMNVIDLGSSPGGWSLYVKKEVGSRGNVLSYDVLPMNHISGVDFLQGNCADFEVLFVFQEWVKSHKVHVVLSDMSPKITGISVIDINKSIYLANLALEISRSVLISGGIFLVKVFQGKGFDEYLKKLCLLFNKIKICKPNSSRACSREVYVLAKKYVKFN